MQPLRLLCLVYILVIAAATARADDCPAHVVELAKKWVDKLNITSNPDLMQQLVLETSDESLSFTVKGVGTFAPRVVAAEYIRLIFPLPGNLLPAITSRHRWDGCALNCHDGVLDLYNYQSSWFDNLVATDANYNANLDADYRYSVKDLRLFTRLKFNSTNLNDPTIRITSAFLQPERQWLRLFNARPTSVNTTCALITSLCTGSLQQYASFDDCYQFISTLPPSPCPFPSVSNTLACRALHATSALIDPVVHCPHTAKVSPVCYDSCLPDCTNCNFNNPSATCVDDYIDVTTPHYKCSCLPGYAGNGVSCALSTCAANWQCPGQSNLVSCNTTSGTCGCAATLTWDSAGAANGAACTCLPRETLYYSGGVPKCVETGKCIERWQCPQSYNNVKCVPTPENPVAIFNACKCNYGFCGGYETDCKCIDGRRIVWSSEADGNVCLLPTECTASWHCAWPSTCTGIDPVTKVGTCTP